MPRLSLHTAVALILVAMGGIALVLVLFSFGLYRDLAEETRAASVRELLEQRVSHLTDELAQSQRLVVLQMQRDPAFRAAWDDGDEGRLRGVLDDFAANRATELGADAFRGLRLLADDGGVVAASSHSAAQSCRHAIPAGGGGSAPMSATITCLHEDAVALSVLVPLSQGDTGRAGSIEIMSDPVMRLHEIAAQPDTAIRIERPGGGVLHESEGWSGLAGQDGTLVTGYLARAEQGDPVFTVRAATDISRLHAQIADTRDFALLAAGSVLAMALLAALVTLRRQLRPLRDLQLAAERFSGERDGAAEFSPVPVRGPVELATPIESFNRMVERIHSLVRSLESEVEQRRGAEKEANLARHSAECSAAQASQEKEFWQITLESIVDAVIATDMRGRVTYLNPVAEAMTGLSRGKARGKTLERVVRLRRGAAGRTVARDMIVRARKGEHVTERDTLVLERADGATLFADCACVPTRDVTGRIVGAVLVLHDVTEARRLTERLTHQATHDALTGLINRYEFDQQLQRAVEEVREHDTTTVLCYLDLDQFKLINDTCGHVAGDEMLRQLSVMLRDLVGNRGTLARLGGDEFGLLLQSTPIPAALEIAEQMRDAIGRFRFVWAENVFSIGVSIGMVELDRHSANTDHVLAAADTACYLAKDTGRNRVQVYHPDDVTLAERHAEMRWISEIHRALEADRFCLYAQDIVPTNGTSGGRHMEILLRLRANDGSLLLPGSFLPAAERYDLAPAVDRWVVRHTLAWLAGNSADVDASFSINLSGRSLADNAFLDFVLEEIERSGVPGSMLCFEVTETAAISNLAYARTFMETLKSLGCRFSLDDFGSGLSSFAYLKNLPVDFLKIDGAFVRDIHRDPVHYSIVRSMNDVGHSMGMQTIAEFVSNENVTRCLREIGVDFLQGYHYSQPQPLTNVHATAAPVVEQES